MRRRRPKYRCETCDGDRVVFRVDPSDPRLAATKEPCADCSHDSGEETYLEQRLEMGLLP